MAPSTSAICAHGTRRAAFQSAGESLARDYLVVMPPERAPRLRAERGTFDQMQLRDREGRDLVRKFRSKAAPRPSSAAASGVQYVELAEVLRRRAPGAELRLVDADDRLLRTLPASAHDYVTRSRAPRA